MSDKLPEWPEKPSRAVHIGQSQWQDYHAARAEAALARMEALAEELRDLAAVTLPQKDERYMRIHELLAACERSVR